MTQPPTLDDRDQAAVLDDLTELADGYVDGWSLESEDVATVLLRIASAFGAETIGQLNRLPEKHRAAFLDSLDFQRRPPQAARLPLSVGVSADLDRNVTVPGGTQAVATTTDDETALFEIPQDRGFEATPASLTNWYAVDPAVDRLVAHDAAVDGGSQRLFAGENCQQHALYFGDDSLLELAPGSVIEIELRGSLDSQVLEDGVCWEYFGVDSDGVEDWHPFPIADRSEPVAGGTNGSLRHGAERLATGGGQSPSRTESAPQESTDETYSVRLRLPNELVSTTVSGTETRWIRCRLAAPSTDCFATEIESVRVQVSQPAASDRVAPDAGFADDVPITFGDDSDIRPFGPVPQPSSTLYLAATEALSKPEATVTLSFDPPATDSASASASAADGSDEPADSEATSVDFGVLGGPPEISWEYWNGTSWVGLAVDTDATDSLRMAGELQFEVPDDIAETAVSGHEARWIRGRLVSGSYGQPSVDVTDPDSGGGFDPADAPRYGSLSVRYDHTDGSFAQTVVENNGVRESVTETADGYHPFKRLSESTQTLYFGFDDVLRDGPIPLFVALSDLGVPQGFDPGIRWEYCTDPETDGWSRLPVDDGTCGLTERGIVSLRFPEPTTAHDRFGRRCHWIRAIVTEDDFATEGRLDSQPSGTEGGGSTDGGGQSTDNPGGGSTDSERQPPVVSGLYPNTQWADNARTIDNEVLGTSDGSSEQRFDCAHGPLIDCEIWVDEAESLSAADREALRETAPDRIEAVTDDRGERSAVWVRWRPVEDFHGVDGDSRVYQCDRSAGTVTFGDGHAGAIPPRDHAIRATYTTGGGRAGNVEVGAISALKTPISLVESVDNPLPADGGSGVEPTEQVASRAAGEIKTRRKAVTASDFEAVATAAVRKLATVDCQPQLGPEGSQRPGSITLLIVPETNTDRPMPSMALETRVEQAVSEAAPARLLAGENTGLTVRGPDYAPVSVDATVRTADSTSLSVLKSELESTLKRYLHPVGGGADGTGWTFGDLPTAADIQSQLRSVAGVEAVLDLSATVRHGEARRRLTRGSPTPELPVDGLVCSGEHTITVQVGDRR